MQSITIKRLIQRDLTRLTTQLNLNNNEAKFELLLLLQHTLNVNHAWLITHENDVLDPIIGQANSHAAFEALLKRRLTGEPVAYILGTREFYGLNLKVTPDTLIPRPDTETLVQAALTKISLTPTPSHQLSSIRGEGVISSDASSSPSFPRRRQSLLNLNQKMDSCLRGNDELSNIAFNQQQLRILDLGTGTGAIALAIAKHRPQTLVTAVDASQAALNIAIENAQNLAITNINFILSDWFSALIRENHKQKFDVIVSNPPYIEASDAHLIQGDLRFEPLSALASGADGLDAIRAIITQAPQHLNPHGWLLLEHGYNQASKVADLLKQAGFSETTHCQDLAGIDRVTMGQIPNL